MVVQKKVLFPHGVRARLWPESPPAAHPLTKCFLEVPTLKRLGYLSLMLLLVSATGAAQNCPKVAYTTTATTLKDLVAAVNCLATTTEQTSAPKAAAPAKSMQAESFQIVGPQHSRPYPNLVMVLLTVPTGGVLKSAVVTPETREANVMAEAGGSCSVKINPDKTVDSRCYIAGGTVYILYR